LKEKPTIYFYGILFGIEIVTLPLLIINFIKYFFINKSVPLGILYVVLIIFNIFLLKNTTLGCAYRYNNRRFAKSFKIKNGK